MGFNLEDFDDDFVPGTGKASVENLSDGEYDFQIESGAFKVIKDFAILELTVQVISGGKHAGDHFQHSLFVSDKESASRVGKDLKTLGFDCDDWTKAGGRPFSKELPKVTRCIKGVRFKGVKKTNKNEEKKKTYHNLYINKRLDTDGLPSKFGPEQLNITDPDDPFSD